MKWVYLIAWFVFILAMNVAGTWHEDALAAGEVTDRKGFWEMLWYGTACIAIFQFFEEIGL